MSVSSMIEIFKMQEVSISTKIRIIIVLGEILNFEYSRNLTEPLVHELVKQLDPNHKIVTDPHYLQYIKE